MTSTPDYPRPAPRHATPTRDVDAATPDAAPSDAAPPTEDHRSNAPARLGRSPVRTILGAVRMAFRADRRGFLSSAALQLVGALAPTVLVLVGQYLLKAITDAPHGRPKLVTVAVPVMILAAVTAVTLVATTLQQLQQRILGERVATYVWNQVLDVSGRVRLESYESSRFYDQLQRLKNTAFIEPVTVTNGVFGLIGGVTGVVGLLVVLFLINPWIVPLLLVAGIPSVLLARYVSRLEFAFAVAVSPIFRARDYLRDTLTGRDEAKEIRVFAAANALRRRHDARTDEYQTAMRKHVRRRQRYAVLDVVLTSVLLAVTLGYVVLLLSHGTLNLAQAAAAILAVRFASTSLGGLFKSVGDLFESAVFLDDLDQFVSRHPDLEEPFAPAQRIPALERAVDVSGVSFTYPGSTQQVLIDVDLRIGANEIVALVGENGSGKTTLAKLVAGLYRPTAGAIHWDGIDIATVSVPAVREHISVIFQDYVRYQLSAQDNIGLGDPDHAEDEPAARQAAHKARALGFLDRLPRGLATILSKEYDDGQDLSQGQWQRVALARALRKASSLVVLDEPTAALDPKAEAQLYADIRHTLDDRAALLISHRFSSVRLADRIYVMQQGQVVEAGTHDALVAADGVYADLFRTQADAYQ